MSQRLNPCGSLKLHRHKPRNGQSGDRLSFSLHNVEYWDIMEVGLGIDMEENMVIYFSKINLISDHVYEIYHNNDLLRKYLSFLSTDLKDGIKYEKINTYSEGEQIITSSIEYKIKIRRKEEDVIDGVIFKESRVYYKELSSDGDLVRKSVPNTEAIRFYLDIYKETVGFHTTSRFGYQEFNHSFIGIVNNAMKEADRDIRFNIALRTEGLEMSEVYKDLKRIHEIKELKIKMQPPNPDNDFLHKLEDTGETVINNMETGNITGMSFVFTSKGSRGLNLESDIIQNSIEQAQALSEVVGDRKAISKGYISVEAVAKDGKKYTTAEQKPLKTIIERAEEFFDACKKMVSSIL